MDHNLVSLYDYEASARRTLPTNVWDFIDAGAMDEITARRNRSALDALALRPRLLRDVEDIDLSTIVLGTQISLPVMIAPAAGHYTGGSPSMEPMESTGSLRYYGWS